MNKDGLLYTIIFSFIVAFVFVIGLAMVNNGTKDLVAENAQVAKAVAVLGALDISYDPANRQGILQKFASIKSAQADGHTYYTVSSGGQTIYALETGGPGLWDHIEVVIGFNQSVTKYLGLEIISQNETPGLGGRITEAWYKNQFKGQAIPASIFSGGKIALAATGSGAGTNKNDGAIDAITGATRTSDAMQNIVSDAARTMKKIVGGN